MKILKEDAREDRYNDLKKRVIDIKDKAKEDNTLNDDVAKEINELNQIDFAEDGSENRDAYFKNSEILKKYEDILDSDKEISTAAEKVSSDMSKEKKFADDMERNGVSLENDESDKSQRFSSNTDGSIIPANSVKNVNDAINGYIHYRKNPTDRNIKTSGDYAYKMIELISNKKVADSIKNILSPGSDSSGINVFVNALGIDNFVKDNDFIKLLRLYPNDFVNNVKDKESFQNIYNAYCDNKLNGIGTKDFDSDLIHDLAADNENGVVHKENVVKSQDEAVEKLLDYIEKIAKASNLDDKAIDAIAREIPQRIKSKKSYEDNSK